jgi:hypothetical protein
MPGGIVFNQGLQNALDLFFALGGTALTGIGVDDGASSFTSTSTSLDGTNVHSKAFESTPTRSSQTVTSQVLFGTGDANFTHKRVMLNWAPQPDTTTPVPNGYGGFDLTTTVGIAKTSAFSFRYILRHTAANSGTGDNLTTNQGLQRILDRLYGISGPPAKAASMGFDDGASAYVAGDTSFTGATAAISIVFDATPTRSAQTVTYIATVPKGAGGNNMNAKTIKRVNINDQASTVAQTAGAITGLLAGVSNQTIRKETDWSLKFTGTFVGTSA